MILFSLIAVLFIGGCAAWIAVCYRPEVARWVALAALTLEAILVVCLYVSSAPVEITVAGNASVWLAELYLPWIPRYGIGFHLVADGLSLALITLTVVLGFMAVSSSWSEIQSRQGFFFFNLLSCLAGTVGVFLAADLFLLFFFWEVMIVPMYFLINIWGHEKRIYAANKFFLFTQVSGLLMLLAIVALALAHHSNSGIYSFDYFVLLQAAIDPDVAFWLMLGFFIAFSVKLPAVPFHPWLPDAHTQAPTGGSVILAGVLLKTGAYGLLRFVIPLFPAAAQQFAPIAMTLGAVSVIYAAMLAFVQSDLKRLIAYTSVSHMGFVMLGIFSWNLLALQGAVVTMLAHGISAAALFMLAGALQERLHTRELAQMGGFWQVMPRLSAFVLFFALATLGLPGLGNFIGEFLVLLGAFKVSAVLTALSALTLVLSPVYALLMVQRALHGPLQQHRHLVDCSRRELASFAMLVLAAVWLGLYPQTLLNISGPALQQEMLLCCKENKP